MPSVIDQPDTRSGMYGARVMVQAAVSGTSVATTISATTILQPNAGAKIKRWGINCTAWAASNTGSMSVTPCYVGTTTALADPIVLQSSKTATNYNMALGPRMGGAGSKARTGGELIDFVFVKTGTITGTGPSWTFWIEWD